ncbi:sulfotransferase family 2 domain-containing protein [Chloroflexota bacterium]
MDDVAIQTEKQRKQHFNNDKTLINFHIFKSAGTTLDRIIERQFRQDATFFMEGGSPQNVKKYVNLLKRILKKDRHRIKYIWGGPFFGVHKYLLGPYTYVTLLRDPVERVISEYYHVLDIPDHPAHSEVVSKNISLEDYVRNGMWLAWNAEVRHIREVPEGHFGYGPVHLSTDDLEIAKVNLHEHYIFGLTERFDELLILLKRSFGWRTRDILYRKQQVGRIRPPKDTISAETVNLIESHNKLDRQLYEFAKQMFKERISQQGLSFRMELQIFRLCNKVNGLIRYIGGIILLRRKC